MSRRRATSTVAKWLASAHPRPGEVLREWASGRKALLPLAVQFDAVRISADDVRAVVGDDDLAASAALVAEVIPGPTILAETGWMVYVLVPRGGSGWPWGRRAYGLGEDHYLGVMAPSATVTPGGSGGGWLRPPKRPGDLCDPAVLAGFVTSLPTSPVRTCAAGPTERTPTI